MELEYTWSKLGTLVKGFYLIAFNSDDDNVECIRGHSGRLMFCGSDDEALLVKCTRNHDHQAITIAYVDIRNLNWLTEVQTNSCFKNLIEVDEDDMVFADQDRVGTSYQEWVIESYSESYITEFLNDELRLKSQ